MEFVNRVANTICGIVKHQKPLALVLSLCATHTFMGVDVLEQYIKAETPIAKTSLLANIGPEFKGAKPGVVVASPSRGEGSDPDYVYTWTRDSALVFKVLVDQYMRGEDGALGPLIKDFITAETEQQKVTNPSGDFKSGEGLGEPKFYVNLTAFGGDWGRPQRDGPALRAITAVTYANHLLSGGGDSEKKYVNDVIWRMIEPDLAYVAKFWNRTTFDLWEEVNSSSFYTNVMQHRALREGLRLGTQLGRIDERAAKNLVNAADKLACYIQTYWNPVGSYMKANTAKGRSSIDANTVLASIHAFDANAGCAAETFQPCSDRALANLKAYVDSFRGEYAINFGIAAPKAVATGRYKEDVYFGGNPWYLTTAACAEQLYDALIVWKKQGYIDVSYVSLPFFKQFDYFLSAGRYNAQSEKYKRLFDAVKAHADEFLVVVAAHTPDDGTLAEQFGRKDGNPLSAKNLTWSYAAMLSAFAAREGKHQVSWGADSVTLKECDSGSHPKEGMVQVTFKVQAETEFGENVYLTGSNDALRHWSTQNALRMSAEQYPIWTLTVALPANEKVYYKFIRKSDDWPSVTWMPGADKELTPRGKEMTVEDVWRSVWDNWFTFSW